MFMPLSGREPSPTPSARPLPVWWTVACVCIVLAPFLATPYAIQTRLQPTEYDDSFA
jgi:hypothetical protein